ncbi:MAG: B12-binding domain-containing radical SAM protein [Acidobacteriia bacterium]|nr:B12-binding domain-containing radical SAM protein [Terriglobia bacterium]
MGLKALLVYPEMPPTYWSMKYALRFIGKKASFPPLGLLTVAAMLPEEFEVTLVDMNVEPLRESAVAAADIVFTSSMIVQKDSLDRVIGMCKKHGKRVVAGGPYPTTSYERIEGVDHFVLNEAEVTLPQFIADLDRGTAEHVYSDPGKPDLALTPSPRFDLLNRKRYSSMALQYSRGCPHSCEFCDIIELFGRRPRTKTTTQFLSELNALYEGGGRGSLFVVDDNFIGNRKEVKNLLPQVARWQQERDYPFSLFTEATLSLAEDEELMDQMVSAGFNMVFLGIETPDRCTLESMGKKQNLKSDMLSSVRRIQAKGMEVSGGFILGFDTDPEDIFDRQIGFIQDAGIPTAMVGLLTAVPNTQLYRRLKAEGRLTDESSGNNTHDLRLNFVPKMDARRLIAGYKRVLTEIYKPDRYFERCLKLLRSLKTHKTSHRRVRVAELRAFALSLLRQTFSRYSWAYWKFLIRGFLAKPLMVAEAVTMAVKGHHFFKMTRNVMEVDRFRMALDDLTHSFERSLRDVSATEIRSRITELTAYRDRVVARMQARCRRINKDFRIYAEEAVARFQARMDELIARLASGLPPTVPA